MSVILVQGCCLRKLEEKVGARAAFLGAELKKISNFINPLVTTIE